MDCGIIRIVKVRVWFGLVPWFLGSLVLWFFLPIYLSILLFIYSFIYFIDTTQQRLSNIVIVGTRIACVVLPSTVGLPYQVFQTHLL